MADLRFLDNSNLSVGPLDNSYTTRIGLPVAVERRPAACLVCRGGRKAQELSDQNSVWHAWRARLIDFLML
jgi:hypothetical protein